MPIKTDERPKYFYDNGMAVEKNTALALIAIANELNLIRQELRLSLFENIAADLAGIRHVQEEQ